MTRREIDALLAQYEPRLREAFAAAIAEITSEVVLKRVVEALRNGNVQAAINAIRVDPRAFAEIRLILTEAYYAAGKAEAFDISRASSETFRFDVSDPAAESWLSGLGASTTSLLVSGAVASITAAIWAGLNRGDAPYKIALDVVGRRNRVTGRREGGVIGITERQQATLARAWDNLVSGVPAKMREYLSLTLRDKRFDKAVIRAADKGRALTHDEVVRINHQLARATLDFRSKIFTGHALRTAVATARDDALWQAVADGLIDADLTKKTWYSQRDDRVRLTHTHVSLDGQTVPFSSAFRSISGVSIRYPHDPQADISETSGCRCHLSYMFMKRTR